MKHDQFNTDFARLYDADRREGREEGLRDAILRIVRARLGKLPPGYEVAIRELATETMLSDVIDDLAQTRDAAEMRAVAQVGRVEDVYRKHCWRLRGGIGEYGGVNLPDDQPIDWDELYEDNCVRFIDDEDAEGTWRELPIVGARLEQLNIFGNPKDSFLRGRLGDGRNFEIPVSHQRVYVSADNGLDVEIVGWGDASIIVFYRPRDGHRLVVTKAAIDYPGTRREWDRDLRAYMKPLCGGGTWCVNSVCLGLRSERDRG